MGDAKHEPPHGTAGDMSTAYPFTGSLIEADFKTPPFRHQIKEFEKHVGHKTRALSWTMRTGKTKTCIDKSCHLYKRKQIDGVLIFAPNGVHANWIENELPKHGWDSTPSTGLVWRSVVSGSKAGAKFGKEKRAEWDAERAAWWKKLATSKSDPKLFWLAINSESMTRADVRKVVARFLKTRGNVHLIVDESDDFANPGVKRVKMLRALAKRCLYRTILSGTLLTGGLLGAYSQYEVLKPGGLGFDKYADFKDYFGDFEMRKRYGGRQYPALIGYKNEDELRERIAEFTSVVLREECDDMPDLVPETRKIVPSEEQLEAYRDLHKSFVTMIGKEKVSIGERTQKFIKLQQVFSGFLKDEYGKVHRIPGVNPRLEALSEECYWASGKVIIWCQFHEDMDGVKRRLLADGRRPVEYHGRVSDKDKAKNLAAFRDDPEVTDLIGHPKSGGRGLDMSVAQKILWYSHTFSARLRVQAMERATKIGGKNIHVVDFEAPGPDAYILSVIAERISVADAIAGTGLRAFLEGLRL